MVDTVSDPSHVPYSEAPELLGEARLVQQTRCVLDECAIQALCDTVFEGVCGRELVVDAVSHADLGKVTRHERVLVARLLASAIRVDEAHKMALQLHSAQEL